MMGYGSYWGTPGYNVFGSMMAGWVGLFLVPFLLWSLFWKGWALWRAAKNDAQVWFIVLLVVNTLGILDILYLFVFGKKSSRKK